MKLWKEFYEFDRKSFIKIFILTVLSGLTGGVGTVMLIPMLSALNVGDGGKLTQILIRLGCTTQTQQIIVLLIAYVVCVTLVAVMNRTLTIWNTQLTEAFTKHLRYELYDAVIHSDWQSFITYKRSDFVNYFSTEIGRISFAAKYSITLLALVVKLVFNVVIAFAMSIPVTLVTLVFGGLFFVFFKNLRRQTRAYGKQQQKANQELMQEVNNQLNGIKEIRCYGAEDNHKDIFSSKVDYYEQTGIAYARHYSLPTMLLSIGAAIVCVMVFIIAYYVFAVPIARIAVLVYVFARLWPCFSSAQQYIQYINVVLPVYERMKEDIENLSSSAIGCGCAVQGIEFNRDIVFENVSFNYRNSEKTVISNADFSIKKGEVIAFVGESGAGKSTLVDILLGFLHAGAGRILVDGKELKDGEYASFCRSISYIPQDPLLINGSVRENLKRFHPDAGEEMLIEALKKAQIWDTVSHMPDGIDTEIGDRGIKLSGGERQRIVLARALLGKPKLLVLDEATNALDIEKEKQITDLIMTFKGEITIILVSHRQSVVEDADKHIYIKNGNVNCCVI